MLGRAFLSRAVQWANLEQPLRGHCLDTTGSERENQDAAGQA